MVTYGIGIVAHPDRTAQALNLAVQVGADTIVMDRDHLGERWCHQETLRQLIEADADWLVLIEDDAIPCDDFRASLGRALNDAGDCIVSLYLGRRQWAGTYKSAHASVITNLTREATASGANWITTNALWHAVGIAIPTKYAPAILARMERDPKPTDEAITHWATATGVHTRYTWPSLLNHDDALPTLDHPGQPRPKGRTAWQHGQWPAPQP